MLFSHLRYICVMEHKASIFTQQPSVMGLCLCLLLLQRRHSPAPIQNILFFSPLAIFKPLLKKKDDTTEVDKVICSGLKTPLSSLPFHLHSPLIRLRPVDLQLPFVEPVAFHYTTPPPRDMNGQSRSAVSDALTVKPWGDRGEVADFSVASRPRRQTRSAPLCCNSNRLVQLSSHPQNIYRGHRTASEIVASYKWRAC